MNFVGRKRELRTIRERSGGPGPALTLVTGRRGAGKTALLRAALDDLPPGVPVLWHAAPPLPDADQRALLAGKVASLLEARPAEPPVEAPGRDAPWPAILGALDPWLYRTRSPVVLVLDGWERMVDARGRLPGIVADFWADVRRRGLPLHLIVASRPGPATETFRGDGALAEWVAGALHLGSLPFREVLGRWAADAPPRDGMRLHAVFGGWPDVLARVPTGGSLARSLEEAVLGADAPLLRWGSDLLEREVQSPARYAALLRAVSRGEGEWGGIRDAVPDFTGGGQMAPYLRRLEELELLTVERSLDAPPRSRRRRYRVSDPFVAFWFRFVLPHLGELERGGASALWREKIRPTLDEHVGLLFPGLCREYLVRHGDEGLGAVAREAGGLWGAGYDLPVAATLRSGAVVYGAAHWSGAPPDEAVVDAIEEDLGRTRYGFGREARLRVVFTALDPAEGLLRRAARDDAVVVVGARDLVGQGEGPLR